MSQQTHCIFIKNEHSQYCYANHNFIQLMGLRNLKQLQQASDQELSKNKSDAQKYQELDAYVLEEEKTLSVSETLRPQLNQPIEKTMEGTLYPIATEQGARFVFGVVYPSNKLLKLDFATLFTLNQHDLNQLLIKRSYSIQSSSGTMLSLSKMEIRTIIELLKGAHAGEIAQALQIKQTTIESYVANIKNKLSVRTKKELIQWILTENILEQIII